ncbi:MAG: bifunctional YncE family protein/alkaline phosphatase family protein [Bryobacteraceae bacterium]
MPYPFRIVAFLALFSCLTLTSRITAAEYRPPAGTRPVVVHRGAQSILPGGRAISPVGRQFTTGPGPFGVAINASGDRVVTADGGPNRYSLTFAERDKKNVWRLRHQVAPRNRDEEEDEDEAGWRSVFQGLAFKDDRELFVSEGNSGRVRLIDARNGRRKRVFDVNQNGARDSYTGDLAYDAARERLYVLDQANFRLVAIDTRARKIVASVRTGRLPFAMALSPDGKRAYVANIGMFEYSAVPGAVRDRARETGLRFPAFGFPSPEAMDGAKRETVSGPVDVPGLGDPNVAESNSLAVIDLGGPPKLVKQIRTGRPFGGANHGGSSPSGVTATADRVYVSNGHNDSITVIDAESLEAKGEIALRIAGLEQYRGILPMGSTVDPHTGWLLVAAAGINAVVVIDTKTLQPLGLAPTAWFPTQVRIHESVVWVSCAKGHGTGPNANRLGPADNSFHGERRRGALVSFPLPDMSELEKHTAQVFYNAGFVPSKEEAAPLPAAIEHVVVIVKENRTFDEVFGDIETASNGPVNGIPILARFGKWGVIQSPPGGLRQRLALRNIQVTPNHHALAERFAFSDNFYADSEVSVDGHHWIAGSYPNAWTESTLRAAYGGQKDFRLGTAPGRLLFAQSNSSVHPEEQLEAGALWHHLERNGISFRNFGEGFELAGVDEGPGLTPTGARFVTNVPMPDPLYRNTSRNYPGYNMNIPDQYRATQFINEIEEMFAKPGKPLPRFLFIHLPNDHMTRPRPDDGYPFDASYVADNDYALGRIVEYLSHSPWWPKMAIFVTEDDAQGGVDHIDSHRTVLLAISPYAKKKHVSRVNASFPGLLKTVFRLLRIPPLNLYDATAADLADCFRDEPDFARYEKVPVVADIFVPEKAKEPDVPRPSPAMDDPRELQRQHRRR